MLCCHDVAFSVSVHHSVTQSQRRREKIKAFPPDRGGDLHDLDEMLIHQAHSFTGPAGTKYVDSRLTLLSSCRRLELKRWNESHSRAERLQCGIVPAAFGSIIAPTRSVLTELVGPFVIVVAAPRPLRRHRISGFTTHAPNDPSTAYTSPLRFEFPGVDNVHFAGTKATNCGRVGAGC